MQSLIQTLRQAFAPVAQQYNVDTASLSAALHHWYLRYPEQGFIHPCVINKRPALVCSAGLARSAPQAFAQLLAVSEQHGLFVKQDQRQTDTPCQSNRRVNTGVVLGFCLGLMSAPVLSRDSQQKGPAVSPQAASLVADVGHLAARVGVKNGRKIIALRHIGPPAPEKVLNAYSQKKLQPVNEHAVYKIGRYLRDMYQVQAGDPFYIKQDLSNLARYYARFPAVVELLQQLSQENVVLRYKQGFWQARALGTAYSVDQVTVYFDSRVGARFIRHRNCTGNPGCHVMPADALLHELLHAKLMIVDSEQFIQQGGMKPTLYLFDHEKQVIEQENALYRLMTKVDGWNRPIRSRHAGDLLHVSCPLCLPQT